MINFAAIAGYSRKDQLQAAMAMQTLVSNEHCDFYDGPVLSAAQELALVEPEPEGYNPYDHVPAEPQPGDRK